MAPDRLVILSAPRTGSNWLCTLLDSHPEILCHHEIFNPHAIHPSLAYRDGQLELGTVADRDRDPESVLERVWAQPFGHRIIGFKLCKGQNPTIFRNVLADRGIRKVIIERGNRIKTYVSEAIAEVTGEWESYPGMPITREAIRIEIEVDRLRAHIDDNRRFYNHLRATLEASQQNWLALRYEDLPHRAERRRVLTFLDVPDQPLTESTRKQNPRSLPDMISNFDALARALEGSDLEADLHSKAL